MAHYDDPLLSPELAPWPPPEWEGVAPELEAQALEEVPETVPWPPPQWQGELETPILPAPEPEVAPEAAPAEPEITMPADDLADVRPPDLEGRVGIDPASRALGGEPPAGGYDPAAFALGGALEEPASFGDVLTQAREEGEQLRQTELGDRTLSFEGEPEPAVPPSAMSDEELLLERTRLQREDTQSLLEADRAQARENQEELQRDLDKIRHRTAQLAEASRQVSQMEVDPSRWWSDRSTGKRIAGYASAVLGGLLAPYRGGRNSGIELIERAIERDIRTQQANIQNQRQGIQQQRGLLQDLMNQGLAEHEAAEVMRQAAYDTAIRELEKGMGGLHPQQRSAIEGELMIRGLQARKAESLAKHQEKEMDQEIKWREYVQGYDKHMQDMAKGRQDLEKGKLELQKARRQALGGAGVPVEVEAPVLDPTKVLDVSQFDAYFMDGDKKTTRIEDERWSGMPTPEQTRVRQELVGADQVIDHLQTVIELGTNANLVPDFQKKAAGSYMRSVLLNRLKLIDSRPSDKDMEQLFEEIAIPSMEPQKVFSWLSDDDRLKMLKQYQEKTREVMNRKLAGWSLPPIHLAADADPIVGGYMDRGRVSLDELHQQFKEAAKEKDPEKRHTKMAEATKALRANLQTGDVTGNLTKERRQELRELAGTLSGIPDNVRVIREVRGGEEYETNEGTKAIRGAEITETDPLDIVRFTTQEGTGRERRERQRREDIQKWSERDRRYQTRGGQ